MSWTGPPYDPTNPDLLGNLRSYLISMGLVRDPRDATKQGILPTCWIDPRMGLVPPGQMPGAKPVEVEPLKTAISTSWETTLALKPATDIPPARYENFLRYEHVEIEYIGRTSQPVKKLENLIRAAINDKRAWMMGQVQVIETLLFRGLSPLGSDNLGFRYSQEYQFQVYGAAVLV